MAAVLSSCGSNPPDVPLSHYRTVTFVNDLPQPALLSYCTVTCAKSFLTSPISLDPQQSTTIFSAYSSDIAATFTDTSYHALGCVRWHVARTEASQIADLSHFATGKACRGQVGTGTAA